MNQTGKVYAELCEMADKFKIRKKIINYLLSKFPDLWLKDGYDFAGNFNEVLWSGESSTIDEMPVFDFMGLCQTEDYIDGIHHRLKEESEKLGLYWEFYDSGTALAYKIKEN